jgi:ABC-type Fe3+ transport system permease subunit
VAVLLLLVLSVAALVGRVLLWRDERRRYTPRRTADRGDPLDIRDPRDALILVVAGALGAASVLLLLGAKLGP